MNKYLEKVAEFLSDENKTVVKTFATQTAASIPAHAAGLAAGAALGKGRLDGAANVINKGVGGLAKAVAKGAGRFDLTRKPGAVLAKKIRGFKGLNGKVLGGLVGMQAAGGLADIAALKHGVHGKVNKK